VVEPRQRWRLVVARSPGAPALAQREVAEAWTAALDGAGLPLVPADSSTRARPRISFGAPLPVGMAAEGELIDVILADRWPIWRIREALTGGIPEGWHLVDLFDVWLAGPPLAGRVAAADYRITLAPAQDVGGLERATADLLATGHLPRERAKGAGTVTYDLRPLLIDLAIERGPPVVVRVRTRFHPELGTGRPEEVIAAIGDRHGAALEVASIVRERLVLADDL
jgi:radical SAM-linked protein